MNDHDFSPFKFREHDSKFLLDDSDVKKDSLEVNTYNFSFGFCRNFFQLTYSSLKKIYICMCATNE